MNDHPNEHGNDDPQLETGRRKEVSAVLSFVLALGVVAAGFAVAAVLFLTRETPEKSEVERPVPAVVAVAVEPGRHVVRIDTQGVIESRRLVRLAAEVGGQVAAVSPQLVAGGRVDAGEELVWIERSDYEAAHARAVAALKDAELALEVEKARAVQARRDWDKLGRGEAPELVLRVPQIASAEARIESAKAEVERSLRDLERTTIRAPFAGRVRMESVEEGAVLIPGTTIAEIYSDEDLELRLPFPLEDFGFLRAGGTPPFEVEARMGGELRRWPAELVRIDGEVERATLSGYGIAKVGPDADGVHPPVGLFVTAVVLGEELDEVVEVPRAAVRPAGDVWLVHEEGDSGWRLRRTRLEVLRSGRDSLVARGDIREGERLVLTRLEGVAEGDEVRIAESETD